MTTTKNSVSRKSGIIALSCALLALTFLSGCGNNNKEECSKFFSGLREEYRQSAFIEECRLKRGTLKLDCVQDADIDGDGIPDAQDADIKGDDHVEQPKSGAKK